jgi:NADH-quinone oxidoreductase subunit L
MFSLEYYSPWLVWLFPIASSLIVPLVAKFNSKARDSFVIVSGIITLVLAMSMIPGVYPGGTESTSSIEWIPIVDVNLGVFLDPLSVLFTNLIAFIGLIVLIYSLSYMAHEEGLTRYYFLMLFFIGSMNGLVIADNFFQMFIFWELVGLCSYALVSFWYKHPEAVRASIKVFLMTKIGDIALLAGILLVYANLHVLSYKQVFEQYGTIAMPMLTLISLLMLLGAVVKSAQLPLHTWLYSAMEAPTSVSCLLHGATMVKGGVYLIARTLVMFSSIPIWLTSVAWIGAVTALIGATLALHTSDVKGVPAYSTVSQIGFMIAALGAAPSPQSLGWFASLFHMISHAFFQGLGFLTIGGIVHQVGTRDMRKMGGLRKSMPITFVFSIIVILSRSGIPPFSSFFSKGLIASSLLATGNIALIFLIYSSAAITFAYSYRFLVLTFAGEKSEYIKGIKVHEAPRLMCASSGVLAAGCIILGFLGEPIVSFLGTNFTFDLTKFFSLESSVFIIVLFVGGFPTYLAYQRKTISIEKLRKGAFRFLDTALENGYFFDTIYGGVASCFTRVSNGLHDIVEMKIMERIPVLVATGVTKLASITLENFDATLDKLTYVVAQATAFHSLKIKRIHSGGLPHFVLAAVLGFFLLCILLLLTM